MPIDKEKIAQALTTRGATKPCHRCGNDKFVVIDGYAIYSLQDNLDGGLVFGDAAVPVALVACEKCGALTPHAVGALGLLPPAK
jgi:hypothetical protein